MTYPAETFSITLFTSVKDECDNEVVVLTMREPRVLDRIKHSHLKGTEEENEVAILAGLCGVHGDVIKNLTVADYEQLQEQLAVFMVPPSDRPAARLKMAEARKKQMEDLTSGICSD